MKVRILEIVNNRLKKEAVVEGEAIHLGTELFGSDGYRRKQSSNNSARYPILQYMKRVKSKNYTAIVIGYNESGITNKMLLASVLAQHHLGDIIEQYTYLDEESRLKEERRMEEERRKIMVQNKADAIKKQTKEKVQISITTNPWLAHTNWSAGPWGGYPTSNRYYIRERNNED